ncbi:uncharacterized protein [Henckelia pumila]|uniref:uncharacterized protein n=1 Tax=Henckelia pumila TaxID=405737 RepID=UPI003C6E1E3D
MQAAEADPDTTLITGRILVAGVATRALLDSGATHSFISEAFTHKRGIECEELFGGFTVTIPSGEELSTRNIVKNLELLLQGQPVSSDMIVFPMPEFDMILGMDWMTKNAMVIEFQQRSVMIISFMQAKQLVHDGCETFLSSISLTELPAHPDISDVDVVRDFEDLFPDDVAGIPPDREVEFSIDLVPDTVPISKAPYRLAPTEMKDREEHSQHLKTVLEVLREQKLFAKFEKSLTNKNAKFVWGPECQKSFDVLKEALTMAPVLAMPSGEGDFVVYTNDSKLGLGAVLMQQDRTVADEIQRFGLEFYADSRAPRLSALSVQTTLFDRIRVAQAVDEQLRKWRQRDDERGRSLYLVMDGIVRFRGRLWVPAGDSLQVKAEHQRPAGFLNPLPIPEWKWENITMDFVVGLPRTVRVSNAIWVIVDRLTKSAHFLPTDGQSERVIQILEDLLRACVIDFHDSWESRLPLVEFAYNKNYQAAIGTAPYEALYGRPCRSPILWTEIGERSELGSEIVQHTAEVVAKIR